MDASVHTVVDHDSLRERVRLAWTHARGAVWRVGRVCPRSAVSNGDGGDGRGERWSVASDMVRPSTTRCSPGADARLSSGEGGGRGPVAKTFRPYDPHQVLLLPPSLEEWLPEGHLARFVSELVEEALDLSVIRPRNRGAGIPALRPAADGQAADLRVLHGQRSSRGIEKRCWTTWRSGTGGGSGAGTTARSPASGAGTWRRWRGCSCRRCGCARRRDGAAGKVALDGTKLRANASRHKAMSYSGGGAGEAAGGGDRCDAAEAERQDAAEDERYGPQDATTTCRES